MSLKTVSVEQLALETGRVVAQARKGPVLVQAAGQPTLVLRHLVDDDLADELLARNPEFRASIRKARKNRVEGKGISLARARRRLKKHTANS